MLDLQTQKAVLSSFAMENAWEFPQYSRSEVDRAGEALIYPGGGVGEARAKAMNVTGNWRASHRYPLTIFFETLGDLAQEVCEAALDFPVVSARLKRLPAIAAKLRRLKTMRLSQMYDIGGCRAVLPGIEQVDQLARRCRDKFRFGHELVFTRDYVTSPKPDGYRGVHLAYRFQVDEYMETKWSGLEIEVQIRTRLQHAWATAVESVEKFTDEALETNVRREEWDRLFTLMATAIALREGEPIVPGTPDDERKLISELKESEAKLNALHTLDAWRRLMKMVKKKAWKGDHWLLFSDPVAGRTRILGIPQEEAGTVRERYAEMEEDAAKAPGAQAVLVRVESLEDLLEAYASYFLNTLEFTKLLRDLTK